MGALLTSILQEGGRAGGALQEARTAQKDREFDLKKKSLELSELQDRIREMEFRTKEAQAPQNIATYRTSGGKTVVLKRDPSTGKITPEVLDAPSELSPTQQKIEEVEQALGRKLEPAEKDILSGLLPKPSTATEKVEVVNGVPVGIRRYGKLITPGAPGWTAQDDVTWKDALSAYQKGETQKTRRAVTYANSRANAYKEARLDSVFYDVYDKSTGNLEKVSGRSIATNPGRYSGGSISQKQKNASAVFDEIDASRQLLSQSIEAMPNEGFDAKTRAELALVLREPDPRSAMQSFVQSTASQWLEDRPEVVDYLTTLASMQESAMSLRTVAGMGQGSDLLRNAILKMLPGPYTPSKAWAQKQMSLLDVQIKALRHGLMNLTPSNSGSENVITVSPEDMK